ncbi:MAG: YicC family protein [Neisseriaceae bacterium]|nr:MAG: YicC family protein [Neisseriaceae bacterium]
MYSMTGYANTNANYNNIDVNIELKSVNHRYLNISLKLPEEVRLLEQKINALLSKHISRGKVECRINIHLNMDNTNISLNDKLTDQLIKLNKKLVRKASIESLTVADILKFPGVLSRQELNLNNIEQKLLEQVEATCIEFNQSRKREGKNLKEYLLIRITKIEEIVQNILLTYPKRIQEYSARLTEKLNEVLGTSIQSERLNQEIALYIQKIDIDEELSRLQSHINETKRLLLENDNTTLGKRLDFMMQEFNRESNTLASKSNQAELTQSAIELKVLIEQMREQIQNIE